jgi:hypothetical protein
MTDDNPRSADYGERPTEGARAGLERPGARPARVEVAALAAPWTARDGGLHRHRARHLHDAAAVRLVLYTWSFVDHAWPASRCSRSSQVPPDGQRMAEIRVERLHKAFADFVAVKDSTFTVRDGEFFCLLGPSGCGKTTTLRMIAGLELPTSGQIFLGDEDVTFKRASHRDIAFVFQLFALYPAPERAAATSRFRWSRRGCCARARSEGRGGGAHPADRAICSTSRCRACRAATASASRSAARSCASRSPS